MSSTEAEYVALSETCKETIWLKRLLQFFDVKFEMPIIIWTDSQSCMNMITNERFSNRTKHIDVKFHYSKEMVVARKEITLKYIETANNIADLFTKPLTSVRIRHLIKLAGMRE